MKQKGQIASNKKYAMFVVMLCLFGVASCTKPIPVAFNSACQKEYDNIYVSVEGYLTTGTTVLCSMRDGTRACGLELVDTLDGTNKINVYLEEGTGKSQMEALPKNYSNENLKVRDRDGQILGARDRVRVIGVANGLNTIAGSSYTLCYINVEEIERP